MGVVAAAALVVAPAAAPAGARVPPAAVVASAPPFDPAGGPVDRGDGVRAQAGFVTGTDPTDGPVRLDTTLYLPAGTGRSPAVLLSHGFGGSKASVDAQAMRLARDGLAVLAWTAPGFGASGGSIGLMSLDHEIPVARALLDHLAAQPGIRLDGPGDPRVGVAGGSYGGAASLELAGTDARVDAVAAAITWNDLAQALFPDDGLIVATGSPAGPGSGPAAAPQGATAAAASGRGPLKSGWAATLFSSGLTTAGQAAPPAPAASPPAASGTPGSSPPAASPPAASPPAASRPAAEGTPGATGPAAACGRFRLEFCLGYAEAVSTGRLPATLRALLARSSPAAVLGRVRAPTLLVQGARDTLFGLDQAEANARALEAAGVPVTVRWYAGGHDAGTAGQGGVEDATADFLLAELRATGPQPRTAPGPIGFAYDLTGRTDPTTGLTPSRTVETDGYPVPDGSVTRTLALTGRPQQVVRPPGGRPAALTAATGLGIAAAGLGAGTAAGSGGTATGGTGTGTAGNAGGGSADGGSAGSSGGATGGGAAGAGIGALLSGGLAASPPGQTAEFTTAPLASDLTVTGRSRIRLTIAGPGSVRLPAGAGVVADRGDGPLFGRLVDVAPDGTRTLLGAGASPFTVAAAASGAARTVEVALPGAVTTVERGHRLVASVATTDASFVVPGAPAAYRVALAPGSGLLVPSLPGRGGVDPARVRAPLPRVPFVGSVVVLVLLALGMLASTARRFARRARTAREPVTTAAAGAPVPDAAAEPEPLVVRDLVKAYPGGHRAVDGVSFRVRRGEVLGLLGPNGAGKTTTLRVLLGLLRASSGSIEVFGEPVGPGAQVLSRVGAFVEGPGVLPHLTGRANLRSAWAATGRPPEQAGFEEVLRIAGLGEAVDRRARTYSQGMRQRLAIAQAMLGTPDLLVLDEPTNGLDPPQIAAMRRVVRDYAASGRTVVLSSHLLAEVEQTCDSVVVMARGRVVAAAPVAELVGASGPTLFEITALDGSGTPAVDAARLAARTLAATPGVRNVEVTGPAAPSAAAPTDVSAELGEVPRARAVAALVAAGVGVSGVRSRNRLEDAFLQLVSPGGGDGSGDRDGSGNRADHEVSTGPRTAG